ncbi:uncharacterized protein L201_001404 [Kwoniella dendrophila CBS 6074]|uniref:NAD-dependent epimerase/dehydratase domain-containing protein n=1 Tax=Kwoniella dendrophila CBS 6074 TaxID=1295534 RepID=A0AAX4JM67_9TREE
MKVFITGGSGWIGSRIIPLLVDNKYEVLALSRSAKSDPIIQEKGGKPIRGDIEDVEFLENLSSQVDHVIHLAFNHDGFGKSDEYDFAKQSKISCDAVLALSKGLSSKKSESKLDLKQRILINTSGTLAGSMSGFAGSGKFLNENDIFDIPMRPDHYKLIEEKGLIPIIIRLSPVVYGKGDKGFIKNLFNISKQKGISGYPENSKNNRWTTVHVNDAAELYLKALQLGKKGYYHGVSNTGLKIKDIAKTIGDKLNLPTEEIENEKGVEHFGHFMNMVLGLDAPASNDQTKILTGWEPKEIGLLELLKTTDDYFV